MLLSLSGPPNHLAYAWLREQREGRRHGAAVIGVCGGDVTLDKHPHPCSPSYLLIFRQVSYVVGEPLLFFYGTSDYLWEVAEQPRGPTLGTDRDRGPLTLHVLPDFTLLSGNAHQGPWLLV